MKTPTTITLQIHVAQQILARAAVLEDSHAALVEGLEKAAVALDSMADGFRIWGLDGQAAYAHKEKERIDLLLAQAKVVTT